MAEDTLTKRILMAWLAGTPDDANIALQIHEFGQLEFSIVDADGQERMLRVGVILPGEGEQIDPETNGH